MKKIAVISIIMIIISVILINTTNADFTVGMSMEANQETISVGDEETLTLSLNEKIIASNFEIAYNSDAFELVGSATTNLSVAQKDGKIACIYADMSGEGTNKLSIKFKAKKETAASKFSIENAKFRADGQDKSYTGSQISGISKALEVNVIKISDENKSDNENIKKENTLDNSLESNNQINGKTTSTINSVKDTTVVASNKLPNTGKGTGYILLITAIVLLISSIIFGKKSKELDKIFSSISVVVLAMVITTSMTTKVYAADSAADGITIRYNDNLLDQKQTLGIMLESGKKQITKSELLEKNTDIIDIIGTRDESNNLVCTGDIAKINDKEYIVVLYGDANGDGIICDSDDIMVIIKEYLGIKNAEGEYRLAANLCNTDDILDIDDVVNMINFFLGNLTGNLVENLPESTITITTPEEDVTGKKIMDALKVGDYVDCGINYETSEGESWINDNPNKAGWRVLTIDTSGYSKYVELVSSSVYFHVDLNEWNDYADLCSTINESYATLGPEYKLIYANLRGSKYVYDSRIFNYEDVEKYLGVNLSSNQLANYKTNDMININQMYGLWKYDNSDNSQYILGVNFNDNRGIYNMKGFKFGARVVVRIGGNEIISGGNGTQNNPYKLK